MVYIERDIEAEVGKWLEKREILILRGPRQSGKTTILTNIKNSLQKRNIPQDHIHYVDFEDDLEKMKFEKDPKAFVSFHLVDTDKHYFLFDEVQYVKNAGKIFKLLFDSFSNIKCILTGSSSFDLTNLGASLVGRVIFFNVYPFSFKEFLRTKGEKFESLYKKISIDMSAKDLEVSPTLFTDDLNVFLDEYLTFGSYPRIVLEENKEMKKELLKNLFTTYIEKDIVGLYGKRYRENVVKLLKAIATMTGSVVDFETLRTHAGLKYDEVREILPLLEDSFVIFILHPFHKNIMNELRKNPKLYFMDYGMRNYLLGTFDEPDFGALYENFVHNQLIRKYKIKYWRTTAKTEVDFVIELGKEIIPLEVKITPKITRSFRSFVDQYHPRKAFLVNRKECNTAKIENTILFIVPLAYF